ncbi:sugar phosphate isomerase/epimerase family protein [Dactylosporangium sucinum]|uniref:Sugar phosphate isomerase n=1 Tax=Dactylosporangium sucinum TaxID=1424081 RepID=A0A917WX38_9ACTN|nr:sugar phosphate isomerase/epimerase family protein [Dactylosporangium sucinum]GGM37343.1 sugar phosphate isomerase [Dactylosporangium sucinum]
MIGLGTYAFFWQLSDRMPRPLTLAQALERTAAQGVGMFQICDYPKILTFGRGELRDLRRRADDLGLRLELGTRGTTTDHLTAFLRLADVLEAAVVRTMLNPVGDDAPLEESEGRLRAVLPDYDRAGVTIALETYERVSVRNLRRLVEAVGSDRLGICLDPGNGVAALDLPRDTVERCAPYVKDVHVKDFAFTRSEGWVGFQYTGTPLGTGLLDYAHLERAVRPEPNGIAQIVEHWLPWQGDPAATAAEEQRWTSVALEYLRDYQKEHDHD